MVPPSYYQHKVRVLGDLILAAAFFVSVVLVGCAPAGVRPGETVKVYQNGYTETVAPVDHGSTDPWADLGQDIDIRTPRPVDGNR